MTCVTRKQTLRSLLLSYQKKDGQAWPHPSFFWYDTDFSEVDSADIIDYILLVWQWQRPQGLFSRDASHVLQVQMILQVHNTCFFQSKECVAVFVDIYQDNVIYSVGSDILPGKAVYVPFTYVWWPLVSQILSVSELSFLTTTGKKNLSYQLIRHCHMFNKVLRQSLRITFLLFNKTSDCTSLKLLLCSTT